MRRALAAGSLIAAALGAAALAAPGDPVAVTDGDDVAGKLDLRRVALAVGSDQRLRATLTMADAWAPADLLAASGPPGSVCLRLWTTGRAPSVTPPDHLVCVTVGPDGETLTGSVMRERDDRPPRHVAAAQVARPSDRTVILRFGQSAIGKPARLRFAAETTEAGCARPTRCTDTAPDAPRSKGFQVRRAPATTR